MKKIKINLSLKTFLLSTLVHLSLFALFMWTDENQKNEVIEIVIIDKKSEDSPAQIVKSEETLNEEIPEKTRFLSQKNQKVKVQTQRKSQPGSSAILARPAQFKKKFQFVKSSLRKFMPLLNEDHLKNSKYHQTQNQKIKNIQEGSETLLNKKEFLYYAYYSRIQEKIKRIWRPKVIEKLKILLISGRSIASYKDRVTKCIIVLNSKGTLVGVQVIKRSGAVYLDEAAIEAFRAAEPFPNPPKGIIEPDGRVLIRWDFILEA